MLNATSSPFPASNRAAKTGTRTRIVFTRTTCRFHQYVMHQRLDLRVVNRADLFHRGLGQRRQIRRRDVFRDLRRPFRAGNRARHRRKFQNPAQRQLRQRRACGNQVFQLFHRAQAGLKIHAGKRFAAVERLAVAVEIPMVVLAQIFCRARFCRTTFPTPAARGRGCRPCASAPAGKTIPPGVAGKCCR